MVGPQGLLDVAAVKVAALALRDRKLFVRSVDSPPLVDVAADATVDVESVHTAGRTEVTAETPVGEFTAAYLPWRWVGPDVPTLVYHHGSGEDPFDFGSVAGSSFRRLFVTADDPVAANLVAVRAPFHGVTTDEYAAAMGTLENFVGMVAASTALVEAVAQRARERTGGPVLAAGVSLGGVVTALHRAVYGGLDRYAPVFAGPRLADLFLDSAYSDLTAPSALAQPDRLHEVLDFDAAFTAVATDDCRPLLARYDRYVTYDRQRPAYEGMPLAVLDRSHVTGALSTGAIRDHLDGVVAASVPECDRHWFS